MRQLPPPFVSSLAAIAPNGKSKLAAALFALFLGGFGIHKFYLGRIGWGILYLLFCWTFIPAILGIHVAVPLLVSGVNGELFTPNNKLSGVWMYALGLAQTGIALAVFYGAFTRVAAVALGVLWFAGIFLVGLETMLESSMYMGFAVFFFLAGRGPISIDP